MKNRMIIVGASAAGVSAALTLRDRHYDGEIVLLDGESRLPYERPAVSKELLLTGTAATIVPEDTYAERFINLRCGAWATRLHVADEVAVELTDGLVLSADKILLATGGRPRRLAVEGADLPGIQYARTAADAAAIRAGLIPGARVAVIGGGLIGAEVAASAITAGCAVTWIEAGYRCLTRALAAPLDLVMMHIHRSRGVRILTNAAVKRLIGDDRVRRLELADGRTVDADLFVVGIGIEPVDDLARNAGLATAGGVVVDRRCATSHPDIFAAGDVAVHQTDYLTIPGRLEHWRHAQNQGAAAARSMLGDREPYNDLPWFWTDQYEHHLEGCGLPQLDDEIVVRGAANDAAMSVFYLRNGRLAAAASLNRHNDVRAAMRLIARGATPSARELADPTIDLRRVQREIDRAVA
jgi:3-phenylpropionate/trans-cinnamate dioxygenase ferredoxin reductase subunit